MELYKSLNSCHKFICTSPSLITITASDWLPYARFACGHTLPPKRDRGCVWACVDNLVAPPHTCCRRLDRLDAVCSIRPELLRKRWVGYVVATIWHIYILRAYLVSQQPWLCRRIVQHRTVLYRHDSSRPEISKAGTRTAQRAAHFGLLLTSTLTKSSDGLTRISCIAGFTYRGAT